MFSIESTVVFEPREPRRPWAIYSSVGSLTPVKHLAVNLGAPGDRRDARGTVWLTYPRPKPYRDTGLETKLQMDVKFADGGGYDAANEDSTPIAGTETPWIFTSRARGLTQCSIPLRGPDDKPALYDVTLYFTDVENEVAGRRVFDVKVQDGVALPNLDVAAAGGGGRRAVVRRIAGVKVTDNLTIELLPKTPGAAPETSAVLSAIEVVLSGNASDDDK